MGASPMAEQETELRHDTTELHDLEGQEVLLFVAGGILLSALLKKGKKGKGKESHYDHGYDYGYPPHHYEPQHYVPVPTYYDTHGKGNKKHFWMLLHYLLTLPKNFGSLHISP